MAIDNNDKVTKDLYTEEDKQTLKEALEGHQAKIARKASATAPEQIKKLWQAESQKVTELIRKVLK